MRSHQSSFRSILLSRLLLVSLPILLIGVYVAYRKARTAFLDTARVSLTESASKKAYNIKQSIDYLHNSLLAASSSYIFQAPLKSPQVYQDFIHELSKELSGDVYCLQLTQIQNNKQLASNCKENIKVNKSLLKPLNQRNPLSLNNIETKIITLKNNYSNQLYLNLAAPIYDQKGNLKFILNLVAAVSEFNNSESVSLSGNSAIINEKGSIIYLGNNYQQRVTILLNKALQGETNFINLQLNGGDKTQLIVGYSSINSPITGEENQKWIILAISPLAKVMEPLKEIQVTLCYMVFTLIFASVLAMLYIAYELARPIEQIRDYAINKENLNSQEELPKNIGIKEFDQLAIAIDQMLERLQKWGEEIRSAWQEAKEANEVKNEFLTTISHELRTPLNGIINSIRIVKDGLCDNKEEEDFFLEQADNGAIHLFKIINDLLDIGKIEAGKMNVYLEPVDLENTITEVIKMQKAVIQQKGLTLKEPQWEKKIIVQADPGKLKQVFINLLNNAIKFTDQGSININTQLLNNEVLITVEDTGIGIDAKDQHKLFRPFVMVDGTTTRKFNGTGLGLAICYNLIQLMGGKISLYSAGLTKGTTLIVTLPVMKLLP